MGTQLPPSKKGTAAPHFSAHVYRGQTVAHLSYTAELLLLGAVVYSRAHARHLVTDLDALTRPVQRTSTLASRARTATPRRPDNTRTDRREPTGTEASPVQRRTVVHVRAYAITRGACVDTVLIGTFVHAGSVALRCGTSRGPASMTRKDLQ